MKLITSILVLSLFVLTVSGQQRTYKSLPIIAAKSTKADYKIGKDWIKGNWIISPQIESDSLLIKCHSDSETFVFYTDRDSISFKLIPGQIYKFYVLVNQRDVALTVVKAIKSGYSVLAFDTKSKNDKLKFWYEQNNKNEYLNLLRSKYPLDSLIRDTKTDTEKVLKLMHWVHTRWKHNGNNEPLKADAISILDEAKKGADFRCVEYGIVTAACLNAMGLKARTLSLKTKEVETTQYGAGHVLTEVYLNDLKKWILLDTQWDIMPVLNDIPLSAVEFQKAIVENYDKIEIKTTADATKRNYVEWIYPYLFYFNFPLDNREGTTFKRNKIRGKKAMMLVPLGAKNPTVFQITKKLDYCLYTHSLKDFYAAPE